MFRSLYDSGKQLLISLIVALLGVLTILVSAPLHALEVGDIKIESRLNERLNASISLSGSADELKHLKVSLASGQVFKKAGMEIHPLLKKLRFKVLTHDGPPRIKVTSTVAVKEPLLGFVIVINWNSIRLLREYSVLLSR